MMVKNLLAQLHDDSSILKAAKVGRSLDWVCCKILPHYPKCYFPEFTFIHDIGIRGNFIRGDGSFMDLEFGVKAFGLMVFGVIG